MKKKLITHQFFFIPKGIDKILLAMKISCLLTFLCVMQVSATVYSQTTLLDLELKNKTVREALKTLEVKSDFRFFYNDDFISLNKVLTINAHQKGIDAILQELLSNANVTYKIMADNAIVILPISELQQKKITGVVIDSDNGESLIGVSILIEGTNQGAVTDVNGKFSLNIPNPNVVLKISYLGYLEQKIALKGQTRIDIKLVRDVKNLNEVV